MLFKMCLLNKDTMAHLRLLVATQMETGTALHEAAIFGKGDVVRLLLDNGENLRC